MYWTYLGVAPTRSHDPITHITVPGNPHVDDQPQAPIDQTYGLPTALPMTASIPSAASAIEPNAQSVPVPKPTISCSKSSTTTLPDVHFSNPPITIQTTLPTAGLGTAPLNTLQPSKPTSHPAPTIPMIPSLPYGHPPSLSGSPNYHNQTDTLSHGTNPTHYATAASAFLTNPHLHTRRPTSTSTRGKHTQCTTTFPHAPTRACTTTHYASTTTLPVNCHGCAGEQAKVLPAYNENDVSSSFPKPTKNRHTNPFHSNATTPQQPWPSRSAP